MNLDVVFATLGIVGISAIIGVVMIYRHSATVNFARTHEKQAPQAPQADEAHLLRKYYEAKHGTPSQRAKAQQALHELAVDLDLRNGDGALWSIEYPAPKETP